MCVRAYSENKFIGHLLLFCPLVFCTAANTFVQWNNITLIVDSVLIISTLLHMQY